MELKLTDKKTYEFNTDKGVFIVTIRTETACERYLGRIGYDIEFKSHLNNSITFLLHNSWLHVNETNEEFLTRTLRLIKDTNHFDQQIASCNNKLLALNKQFKNQ